MDWKKEFIDFSFQKKLLKFGTFKLKSGRTSPYFFNSGLLCTGKDTTKIASIYAKYIVNSKIKFDILFGPAYKGIPIVVATSIVLQNYYNINISYAFNRKEEKKHGEKGDLIGNIQIKNKNIIILDDVITSGTAIRHTIEIIESKGGKISSIFVLLDRKEKRKKNFCTINSISNQKNFKIVSIITIEDLISYLKEDQKLKKHIPKLIEYRRKYGIY